MNIRHAHKTTTYMNALAAIYSAHLTQYVHVRITKLYCDGLGYRKKWVFKHLRNCLRSEMSRSAGGSLLQASGPAKGIAVMDIGVGKVISVPACGAQSSSIESQTQRITEHQAWYCEQYSRLKLTDRSVTHHAPVLELEFSSKTIAADFGASITRHCNWFFSSSCPVLASASL